MTMKYSKQKYYYKRKRVSTKYGEEFGILSDLIALVYCTGNGNIYVYNSIIYRKKNLILITNKICKDLMKNKTNDHLIKEKMKELLQQQPKLSYDEIAELVGYDTDKMSRFYMAAKRSISLE